MRIPNAFSLLELLMAVSLLAIIALAVTSVTMGMAGGIENNQDYYHCLQSARINMLRMEETIRHALLIADADSDAIWIWREDTNGSGEMDVSETSLIFWLPASQELVQYDIQFPDRWSDRRKQNQDSEVPYWFPASVDWAYVIYFKNSSWLVRTVLAENVTDVHFGGLPAAPESKLVTIAMTVARGGRELTLRSAVKLRDNWGQYIKWEGDQWEVHRYEEP